MIVYGTRMLGRVDRVPGMFVVATQFQHVNAIPLFPLRTYIVVSEQDGKFRGVRIGMNAKSVLLGLGRAWGFAAVLVSGIALAAALGSSNARQDAAEPGIAAGSIAIVWAILMWLPKFKRATRERAMELGRMMKWNEEAMERIGAVYDSMEKKGTMMMPAKGMKLVQPKAVKSGVYVHPLPQRAAPPALAPTQAAVNPVAEVLPGDGNIEAGGKKAGNLGSELLDL